MADEKRAKLLWSGSSYVPQHEPTTNELPIAVITMNGNEIVIHADKQMTPWAKRWIEQIASSSTSNATEPINAVYARIGGPPLGMEPIDFSNPKSAARYDRFTAKLGEPVGKARRTNTVDVRRINAERSRMTKLPSPAEARRLLGDQSPRKRRSQ